VAKAVLALFIAFASAFAGAQTLESLSGSPHPNQPVAFGGGALTCSQPEVLRVPQEIIQRAKLKLRLMNLLRESLLDDAKGIVNVPREREIRKLADKLKNGTE
jgi:NhaP-type Na+/H+ or K+/H+ antiporter